MKTLLIFSVQLQNCWKAYAGWLPSFVFSLSPFLRTFGADVDREFDRVLIHTTWPLSGDVSVTSELIDNGQVVIGVSLPTYRMTCAASLAAQLGKCRSK